MIHISFVYTTPFFHTAVIEKFYGSNIFRSFSWSFLIFNFQQCIFYCVFDAFSGVSYLTMFAVVFSVFTFFSSNCFRDLQDRHVFTPLRTQNILGFFFLRCFCLCAAFRKCSVVFSGFQFFVTKTWKSHWMFTRIWNCSYIFQKVFWNGAKYQMTAGSLLI